MNTNTRRVLSVAILLATSVASTAMAGGAAAAKSSPVLAPQGMPQDWSHSALRYSHPATPQEAARKGRTAQWRHDYQDPRFVAALMGRMQSEAAKGTRPPPPPPPPPADDETNIHRDWSNVLGGTGGSGLPGVYPAKYAFSVTATPSCTGDFVVYPTGAGGATDSGTHNVWSGSMSNGSNNDNGKTIVLGTGVRSVTLTVSTSASTNPKVVVLPTGGGAGATKATNLRNAINRWTGVTGITAGGALLNVTLTYGSAGAGTISVATPGGALNNITLAQSTAGTGTPGQPTIVAFNQLYKGDPLSGGCGLVVDPNVYKPTVAWSFNTGTGAKVQTSPTLSLDGTQVAFIQSTSGNVAQLVLLKPGSPASPAIGTPTAPTSVTLANYRTCTAPCMTVTSFVNSANDSFSSPFVDYVNDILWVGDDAGKLHKFTGVFTGTPAEVLTAGAPFAAVTSNVLGSPVEFKGNVWVGSGGTTTTPAIGKLHKVDMNTGATVRSADLAPASIGVRSFPLIDASANRAYVFVGDDGSTSCGGSPCHAMYQFDTRATAFATNDVPTGVKVQLGQGSATDIQWAGQFDEAYSTNVYPTGSMYVCGRSAAANTTTLWQIPLVNNVMQALVAGATVTSGAATCSPLAHVTNGSNEYLFFGVTANGNATGCTGACLYMFNLKNLDGVGGTTWGTGNTARAGLTSTGGTSAIVVDNVSGNAGSSQLYYANQASPGNAVQTSQANLQ